MEINMNQKLEQVVGFMPLLKEISGKDAEINVWDLDGIVVGNFPSKDIDLPFELGYQITDRTDPIFPVMASGKGIYVKAPAEVFGASIEGYITPIHDGNEVVGCVTYVFSSEHTDEITNQSESLKHSLSNTADSLNHICQGMTSLSGYIQDIHGISTTISKELENVQTIIATIQKNANYSNILALNASIESARVGTVGKGFAVVSSEMRNFAKESSDAAKSIQDTLSSIINSLSHICTAIDKSAIIAQEQKDYVDTVNNSFSDITSVSASLVELCSLF